MKCPKCLMNEANSTGFCIGCNSKTIKKSNYPISKIYMMLIGGTERGEVFEFDGDTLRHDNNDMLQLVI